MVPGPSHRVVGARRSHRRRRADVAVQPPSSPGARWWVAPGTARRRRAPLHRARRSGPHPAAPTPTMATSPTMTHDRPARPGRHTSPPPRRWYSSSSGASSACCDPSCCDVPEPLALFGGGRALAVPRLLAQDASQLFSISQIEAEPPSKAPIFASVPCARCGEDVTATSVRQVETNGSASPASTPH